MDQNNDWVGIKPVLQNRWKLVNNDNYYNLIYYGMAINLPVNRINYPVNESLAKIIGRFDGVRTLAEIMKSLDYPINGSEPVEGLLELIDNQIIIGIEKLKKAVTYDSKRTCIRCVNNNYIIPDLEFNEAGLCALCQRHDSINIDIDNSQYDVAQEMLAYTKDHNSRFDAMVLYTGGKDSSFLLWYLVKKLGLRVLAATFNMPFSRDTAKQNVRSAMKKLPEVEFLERTIRFDEMKEMTRLNFKHMGSPCLCTLITYHLFYPLAVQEKIPLFIDGVEKIQLMMMFNNLFMDTRNNAFSKTSDREATLAELIMQVRYAKHLRKYGRQLSFIKEFDKLAQIVNDDSINLPIIKHLADINLYNSWGEMVNIIQRELDWRMPENNQTSLLHTSCEIEGIKDYCQFKLYHHCRTSRVPQSMVEISSAVIFGYITREQGLKELNDRGYYGEPENLQALLHTLELDHDADNDNHEIKYVLTGDEPG